MATTVRVSEATRARAAELASRAGTSIGEVVDRALDAYTRAQFWEQTRTALTGHVDEPEDAAWERSLRDGLDPE